MTHGIATSSVIPMRVEPSEHSEMVSQLLWGETFKVKESANNDWIKVHSLADNYGGWISRKMVDILPEKEWMEYANAPHSLCTALRYAINQITKERALIPHGAVLYNYNENNRTFSLGSNTYQLQENIPVISPNKLSCILSTAHDMLNAPYLWGGRTTLGVDCSGLTQLCFRMAGVSLPRDAHQQAELGEQIKSTSEAKGGDLAFFINDSGKITHVGIVLENGQIVHSSGKVRIDELKSEGIYNKDLDSYSHKLSSIKRIL
ncbi:MAG: C40 family peptidase [Prevotellaceae bacterium]|jgi:cell wall-associated NlpC family hydrolase|nr:C40 family peptidase [Prevotellaceae bacterium]